MAEIENIQKAEAIITTWDIVQGSGSEAADFASLFHGNRREAKEFIACLNDLRGAMLSLVSQPQPSGSPILVRAQKLMKISTQRLEKEFYHILSANRACLDPESVSRRPSTSDVDHEIQGVGREVERRLSDSALAMSDLRMIADCMISSGYGKECHNIYKLVRKSIVDEGLYRLGIERYSSSQITRMSPSAMERRMTTWLRAVKIAVKTLLQAERFLCDYVFSTSHTVRDSCFANIAKEGATNLLSLPELIAAAAKSTKRWPEKVFRLMDLHEALSDILPDIESIFSHESVSSVKSQALSSIRKLGDSIQTVLAKFESSIQKKNSSRKAHPPGGAIHPLTISVMDYVSTLANYAGILSSIIIGDSNSATSPTKLPFPESYFEGPAADDNETPTPAVSVRLAWIILVLLCKLDTQAESYSDVALAYLFLSNNLQFVLEKVLHSTALECLLGDDWTAKLERKVKVYATNYELMAWGSVFACLPANSQGQMSPDTARANFRLFNKAFDEAYRKQMSWVVPDGKFRDDIKASIATKLVPAYGEFYDRHVKTLEGEKSLEVLVRFSPDNLGNYLSDILRGTNASDTSPPSSTSRALRCLV